MHGSLTVSGYLQPELTGVSGILHLLLCFELSVPKLDSVRFHSFKKRAMVPAWPNQLVVQQLSFVAEFVVLSAVLAKTLIIFVTCLLPPHEKNTNIHSSRFLPSLS
ncbi:unnamed protein product [Mesocestoides corti]|uniref:Ovule protein n=1 Tax=Mesocestoides corti TaxID=53468 RepID=A0A0R3UE56_MESCO|nr:unnamed protein product [Mesocestoides corti]